MPSLTIPVNLSDKTPTCRLNFEGIALSRARLKLTTPGGTVIIATVLTADGIELTKGSDTADVKVEFDICDPGPLGPRLVAQPNETEAPDTEVGNG